MGRWRMEGAREDNSRKEHACQNGEWDEGEGMEATQMHCPIIFRLLCEF